MAANESALGRYAGIGLLAIAGLAVVAVRPVVAYGGAGMMGGGGYGGGTFGMMPGVGGFLWPLLLIGGIVALLYSAGGDGDSNGHGFARSDSALETLRQRYARGELTEAEFEERQRRLER